MSDLRGLSVVILFLATTLELHIVLNVCVCVSVCLQFLAYPTSIQGYHQTVCIERGPGPRVKMLCKWLLTL